MRKMATFLADETDSHSRIAQPHPVGSGVCQGNLQLGYYDRAEDRIILVPHQRPVICSSLSGYRAPCTVILEAALAISRRSSGVSSTATAPMFSSRRCSFVVPGIGTIHGLWASSHARAI